MKIEPENISEIQDLSSDDDSCIFISDNDEDKVEIDIDNESFGIDEESQHFQPSQEQSRIVNITDKTEDLEYNLKDLILQEERFVVMETTEITTERNLVNATSAANVADDFVEQVKEPPVVKLDKATQTEEKDFPKKLSVPESTNKQHTGLAASSVAHPTNSSSAPSCSKTVSPYSRDKINNNKTDASVSEKSKNSNNSKADAVKQTWKKTKSYQNYRVQPYQRYNNYNNYNYWNHSQSNYNRRYNYKDQDNYNRYGIRTHSNYRNVYYPNYTYQFKDRLFHGFVKFMDFVFHYNYANHRY